MLIIIEWKVDNISYDVDTIRLIMSYHHYGSKIYLLFIFNSIWSKNFIFFWHSSSSSWYLWTLMIQFFLLIKIFFFEFPYGLESRNFFISFLCFFFPVLFCFAFVQFIYCNCWFLFFCSRIIWFAEYLNIWFVFLNHFLFLFFFCLKVFLFDYFFSSFVFIVENHTVIRGKKFRFISKFSIHT